MDMGYDESGSRIWRYKANPEEKVDVFLGDLFEIVGDRVFCHVTVGGRKIASFEPTGSFIAWRKQETGWEFADSDPFGKRVLIVFFGGTRWATTGTGLILAVCIPMGIRRRRQLLERLGRCGAGAAPYGGRASRLQDRIFVLRLPMTQSIMAMVFWGFILMGSPQVRAECTPADQKIYYYLYNHLGSVVVVLWGNGAGPPHPTGDPDVEQRYTYRPFGEKHWQMRDTDPGVLYEPTFRFTGQIYEEFLDIYYYKARWYDQSIGRFLQADTEFASGSDGPPPSQALNRYSYTVNNPIMYTDPSGHFIIAMIVGAIISASITAARGGDSSAIWKSAAAGAIGGAAGAAGAGIGEALGSAWVGGAIGGAAGGALGAAVTGSDPATAAAAGGVTGAIVGGLEFGEAANQIGSQEWFQRYVVSVGVNTVVGGTASEIQGGTFADGAANAAIDSAAAYPAASVMFEAIGRSGSTDPNSTNPKVDNKPKSLSE